MWWVYIAFYWIKTEYIGKNLIFDFPSNKGLLKNNFRIEFFEILNPNLI